MVILNLMLVPGPDAAVRTSLVAYGTYASDLVSRVLVPSCVYFAHIFRVFLV